MHWKCQWQLRVICGRKQWYEYILLLGEKEKTSDMNEISKAVFRAIHEGKWLQIEYCNRGEQQTKFWIGIRDMDVRRRKLFVDGLHIVQMSLTDLQLNFDSILSAVVIEGSYQKKNEKLIEDIRNDPERYEDLFGNVANLKILGYLATCNRLDTVPYYSDYSLLRLFDGDKLEEKSALWGEYPLSEEQFYALIKQFSIELSEKRKPKNIELGLNVMSVHLPKQKGLYVLAYRRLLFDIKNKYLHPDDEVTICYEYEILEQKQSIRQFLNAEDYGLLEHFEQNLELIKDRITQSSSWIKGVDDMPYVIALGRDAKIDLQSEYDAIVRMYEKGKDAVPAPISTFFGEMLNRPVRKKTYPFAIVNRQVNMDQLLAINNAMKYPLAYVQGPPGTGKTSTILNTITTAFFNDRTVLFVSYNNHPIDSVFEKLCNMKTVYGWRIPFPVIRLGNLGKVEQALEYMRRIYMETKSIPIKEQNLERNKRLETQKLDELSQLLKQYEELLELQEKKTAIKEIADTQQRHLAFYADLFGRQMGDVERRQNELKGITLEKALALLPQDDRYLLNYLYYASARCIRRLEEPKNKELKDIILSDRGNRVEAFEKYLSEGKNVEQFLRIFPIVVTTCISSHKIGRPDQYFDMVIMDEASQCNTAVSLVPIIRGKNLMLVGDPQQLNPVITLNPRTNEILRETYYVTEEYDYIKNSIYKTYLACDAVSYETLLSHHYRCDSRIIQFSNKKYYHGKLKIDSSVRSEHPLIFVNVPRSSTVVRNTSPEEAESIADYAAKNREKTIGIITPFANQKECIQEMLKARGIANAVCGTVHAFQGDEKDVVLFSLAVTEQTGEKSYEWLKNNKELINVAVSRAKEQLIIVGDEENIKRLHNLHPEERDDLFELVNYVKTNGKSIITPRDTNSRALGIKPYSTQTEAAFLENLNHALDNILNGEGRCSVKKEVPVKQLFDKNFSHEDFFYRGQFDFVVYQRNYAKQEIPILAIELDGKEHREEELVMRRDEKKNQICREHHFELIRVDNSYARRYYHVKNILIDYFKKINGR